MVKRGPLHPVCWQRLNQISLQLLSQVPFSVQQAASSFWRVAGPGACSTADVCATIRVSA